jgi:hypothetical protein
MCCYARHGNRLHAHDAETYPYDTGKWCRCAGYRKGLMGPDVDLGADGNCCGAASGNDGLCDRCRSTCFDLTHQNIGEDRRVRNLQLVKGDDGHGRQVVELDYIGESVPIVA